MNRIVVFAVEDLPFALHLDCVKRVVRAVAARPLPQGPEIVSGIINLKGSIIPVVNVRKRLGLRERELEPWDQLLIASSATRTLAMHVDRVDGVADCEESAFVPIEAIVGGTNLVKGVLKSPGGMMLIQDLDHFLSLSEEKSLEAALARAS